MAAEDGVTFLRANVVIRKGTSERGMVFTAKRYLTQGVL
jgi:hypothetical protein